MKTITICLLISIITLGSFSHATSTDVNYNTGILTGTINDQNTKTPMEYVTIALYSVTDSSLVSGTITNEKGEFILEKIQHGDYYLEISYLGFEKKQTGRLSINPKNNEVNIGSIYLSPATTSIEEAILVAEKSTVEYRVDKRVVNVEKDINAQGGTAADALANTPSIQSDAKGNITLRGSSDFIVLIDGKPSALKGNEALKQLPANTIKQIEVTTNPSAKYDADGQAGIINVILKKEKLQGFSGNFNLSAGTGDKYNSNLLLNYRKNKINFFTGYEYGDFMGHNYIDVNNITYKEDDNLYINETIDQFYGYDNKIFKGGLDFDPTSNHSISISTAAGKMGHNNGNESGFTVWGDSEAEFSNKSNNFIDANGKYYRITVDYTYRFNEHDNLTFSNFYFHWDGADYSVLTEFSNSPEIETKEIVSDLNFTKDNQNYLYRSNIDYTKTFAKGKFESGLQFRYEWREEDLCFQDLNIETNEWVENKKYSYFQDYKNTIISGYAMFTGEISGFEYQAGFRSEYFTRTIDIDTETSKSEFDKKMLYPSMHISRTVNDKHQFQASYSKRVNRPEPWLLNNTPAFVDPLNIFMGSPYLKFEFSDNVEFNIRTSIKDVSLTTQTYFRNTTNPFTTLRLMDDEGVLIHKMANAKNQQAFGAEQGINVKINEWWQINGNVNVYHYTLETLISENEKKQEVNTWDARLITNFTIKENTKLQASGHYRAKSVDAMGETSGFFTANVAISHTYFKGKLNVSVKAQNALNSSVFDYKVMTDRFKNHYRIRNEGPVFYANLAYTFNNFQNKKRGRDDDASFKGGGVF